MLISKLACRRREFGGDRPIFGRPVRKWAVISANGRDRFANRPFFRRPAYWLFLPENIGKSAETRITRFVVVVAMNATCRLVRRAKCRKETRPRNAGKISTTVRGRGTQLCGAVFSDPAVACFKWAFDHKRGPKFGFPKVASR